MPSRGLTLYTTLAVAASALLTGVACALLVGAVHEYRSASAAADRTEQAISAGERLEETVMSAMAGERGFLATGDPQFLDSYYAARNGYQLQMVDLEGLSQADARSRASVAGIGPAIQVLFARWLDPVVNLGMTHLARARARVATASGERQMERLQTLFGRYEDTQSEVAAGRRARASNLAHRAELGGVAAFVAAMLIPLALTFRLQRRVVRPIRRLLAMTRQVAAGELDVRSEARGAVEIGELERGFNAMTESLAGQRAELETFEGELKNAVSRLADEKRSAESLYRFAGSLVSQTELHAVSHRILEGICAAVDADVATLYAVHEDDADVFLLAAALGIEESKLPVEVSPGYGLAGRALEERRTIEAHFGNGGLHVSVLGDDVALQHELHIPLIRGRRAGDPRLGVITLGRLGDRPFEEKDRAFLAHLVEQSGVVLANALASARASRLASLNQTLIDSTLDGIRLIDLDGRPVVENERMTRIIESVVGEEPSSSHWEQADLVAPLTVDAATYAAGVAQVRANPDGETDHEFELQDGRVFRRFTAPVRDAAGDQLGRVVILRELTTERQIERLKNEFVATVTHELRTPLTSIAGFVEVLRDEEPGALNEEQHHFLDIIKRGSDRLLRLVNDLLFVARVDAGKLELATEAIRLDQLVADAVEAATPAATKQHLTLELSLGGLPALVGDGPRLAQLLDNLLSNAVKFTPPAGQVHVSTVWHEDEAVVTVADTGVGIPEHEKERLFQRFFRATTATEGAIQGTGLGLSISSSIVKAHGGSIEATDNPGGGTVFTVRLPLPVATVAAAA